jgi:hypothetical protein
VKHNQTFYKMEKIKLPDSKQMKFIGIAILSILAISVAVKILQKLGIFQTPEEKVEKKAIKNAVDKSKAKILKVQKPTKTAAEWKFIADQLWSDLKHSSLDDKKEDAGYQIARVQNDADFITLHDMFGTRQEWFFGIPTGEQDFIDYVTSNLSRAKLDKVNGNYARKGISFRW